MTTHRPQDSTDSTGLYVSIEFVHEPGERGIRTHGLLHSGVVDDWQPLCTICARPLTATDRDLPTCEACILADPTLCNMCGESVNDHGFCEDCDDVCYHGYESEAGLCPHCAEGE